MPCFSLRRPRRVPAGALSLVLVLSIVISAILLGLVGLYAATQRQGQVQRRQLQVQRAARSGLAYVLGTPELPFLHPRTLDLFGLGTDSVTVSKRPWGLFEIAVAAASTGTTRDTLVALVGSQFSVFGRAALYLPNTGPHALGVAGRSQVLGNAYLPEWGAKAVYVPGHEEPPPGQLVTGLVRTSAPQLPLSADSALPYLRDYITHTMATWLPAATMVRQVPTGRHSFMSPPVVWQQSRPQPVGGVSIAGHVVLLSPYPLVIEASSRLDGVLVLAPKVTLKAGFRGRVQVFARDTIELQAGCHLAYPSALGVYATAGSPAILLAEQSAVDGIVVAAGPASTEVFPVIRMHPTARVTGQLYTTGTLLNCGQVVGTVMCQRLAYQRTPADSRYESSLVDATIDRTHLPAAYLSSPWLNPDAPRSIIQWLQ